MTKEDAAEIQVEEEITIKMLRKESGLTKAAFAKAIGIEVNTLDAYEKGNRNIPPFRFERAMEVVNSVNHIISQGRMIIKQYQSNVVIFKVANSATIEFDGLSYKFSRHEWRDSLVDIQSDLELSDNELSELLDTIERRCPFID